MTGYWEVLISSFATHHEGSPISNLYDKLRALKVNLKNKNRANYHFIKARLLDLNHKHKVCLNLIQCNPLDTHLNASLKEINANISLLHGALSS